MEKPSPSSGPPVALCSRVEDQLDARPATHAVFRRWHGAFNASFVVSSLRRFRGARQAYSGRRGPGDRERKPHASKARAGRHFDLAARFFSVPHKRKVSST